MSGKEITIKITTGTFIKAVMIGFLVFFAFLIKDVIVITLLSVVIATGIEPATAWFQKRKIPRVLGVIITYLITFLVLGALFYAVVPTVFSEFTSFNSRLSASLEAPFDWSALGEFSPKAPIFFTEIFKDLTVKATGYISGFAGGVFQLIATIFGGALSFILIIVLSFYLAVQEKGIENFLRLIIPIDSEKYVIDLWQKAGRKIGLWLQGQILLGLIVGVLSYLGLMILRVDYALTFAILAGVFELIPIFGPILSAVPPVITALLHSPILAGEVAFLYLIIQQLENHLIYPLVVRKIVGIPPIMVILALIIGAKLGGFLGILLAVPAATIVSEILSDIDAKKHIAMGHKANDKCLQQPLS